LEPSTRLAGIFQLRVWAVFGVVWAGVVFWLLARLGTEARDCNDWLVISITFPPVELARLGTLVLAKAAVPAVDNRHKAVNMEMPVFALMENLTVVDKSYSR